MGWPLGEIYGRILGSGNGSPLHGFRGGLLCIRLAVFDGFTVFEATCVLSSAVHSYLSIESMHLRPSLRTPTAPRISPHL